MTDDTLIYFGGDVKALGGGKVGGYLVRFGGPESADVQGDYFAPDTYFGRATKAGSDVVYHHGLGRIDSLAMKLGNTIVGHGVIDAKADGLWIEADVADQEVYAKAEAGLLGWSSGSVDRLVKRQAVKAGVTKIVQWPIIEASLSPKPVDPRNRAIAIKSLIDESSEAKSTDAPASGSIVDRINALASNAASLCDEVEGLAARHGDINAAKREAIKAISERFAKLHDATAPRQQPAQLSAAERLRRKLRIA